jgi:hypothetical protein
VLVGILGYVAINLGLIEPSVSTGYEFSIPASTLNVASGEELSQKLSTYAVNESNLAVVLEKTGITLEQFKNHVSMDLVLETNQHGFQGLVLEFSSSIPSQQLKSVYEHIASEIQNHVVSQNG